jgi:CRP-like cAMP-binding protein
MLEASRSLTNAFWRETLVDAAIYREWVATLRARDAIARIAHILCELAARLDMVGMLEDDTFQMPFTQANLAYACGLSNVHISRTVQEMRHRGLISWQGKTVELLKRKELEIVAEFVPDYLHQSDG